MSDPCCWFALLKLCVNEGAQVVPLTRRPKAAGDLSPQERGEVFSGFSRLLAKSVSTKWKPTNTSPRSCGERSPRGLARGG
jgi:hypothetical protein